MEDPNEVPKIAKSLPHFDGEDKHDVIDFADKLKPSSPCQPLISTTLDMYNLQTGEETPTPTDEQYRTKWERNNTNLSMLWLATSGEATTVVKRYAGRRAEEGLRNGQKAWEAMEDKYDACSNATRQELDDCLHNTKLRRGQDPDEILFIMETTRNRLYEMGGQITDGYFSDMIIAALPPEYGFVRNTTAPGPAKCRCGHHVYTMRSMYADFLCQ